MTEYWTEGYCLDQVRSQYPEQPADWQATVAKIRYNLGPPPTSVAAFIPDVDENGNMVKGPGGYYQVRGRAVGFIIDQHKWYEMPRKLWSAFLMGLYRILIRCHILPMPTEGEVGMYESALRSGKAYIKEGMVEGHTLPQGFRGLFVRNKLPSEVEPKLKNWPRELCIRLDGYLNSLCTGYTSGWYNRYKTQIDLES